MVARAVKQDAALLSACRGFATIRAPVAREPGGPKKHFMEDFEGIAFKDWPKPTEAQKARIAQWKAEKPSYEELDAEWAAQEKEAEIAFAEKNEGTEKKGTESTRVQSIRAIRAAIKEAHDEKVYWDNYVPVVPDWTATRDQHFFPDFVDEVKLEFEDVIAKLEKAEFYNPDFPYLLEWVDEQIAENKKNEPELKTMQECAEKLMAHTEQIMERIDNETITTDELLDVCEFKEFQVDVAEGKKMVHDTLAGIKQKYGNITAEEQAYADKMIADLEKKSKAGTFKEQIEDRVRAGEWF